MSTEDPFEAWCAARREEALPLSFADGVMRMLQPRRRQPGTAIALAAAALAAAALHVGLVLAMALGTSAIAF